MRVWWAGGFALIPRTQKDTMGFLDMFRTDKAAARAALAARTQRSTGRRLAAMPMQEFVPECLRKLNQSGAGAAHTRAPQRGARVLAANKQLPDELADFYCMCDGFESPDPDFPAPLLPISRLRPGANAKPALSERLAAYWAERGNPSNQTGLLAVLPANPLTADATPAANDYLPLSALDQAMLLCPPRAAGFVVLLIADTNTTLPRGTVLEVEGGSATRYPGFKAWLGSRASRVGAMGNGRVKPS